MITRLLYNQEKDQYNQAVIHPVQTWEWGDFQISQGHKVYRLGVFDNGKIVKAYSVSFHKIPKTGYSVGTIFRGPEIDKDMLQNIRKIAEDENAVFVKFEPDIHQKIYKNDGSVETLAADMAFDGLVLSPKVAFYPYSYVINLTQTEEDLLKALHSKTRYNIKVANRHNVVVREETNDRGFEKYLNLLFQTTKRQGFYLHSRQYHQDLWNLLKKTKMPHIMLAYYNHQLLAAFMVFTLKDRLFYPYGASSDANRQVMAPNLLMWEVIRLGKSLKLKTFDMWGSLGPEAKESEQGYGFHRFKQGYGGDLVQYVGTYDLVINQQMYRLYNLVDKYRWKFLRLKAKVLKR